MKLALCLFNLIFCNAAVLSPLKGIPRTYVKNVGTGRPHQLMRVKALKAESPQENPPQATTRRTLLLSAISAAALAAAPHHELLIKSPKPALAAQIAPALVEVVEAFETYRPLFHLQAPKNFMNDPSGKLCFTLAPFQDLHGNYHIYYQLSDSPFFGNVTWGHAVSKDLIHWTHKGSAITPSKAFDSHQVFSGMMLPQGIQGLLTVFYTGISSSCELHWSKKYTRGCEKQAAAISIDNGYSWKKIAHPLLDKPPENYDVVGWRDPHVFQNQQLSETLGLSPRTYFMMVSSGERNVGGRVALYTSLNLLHWNYIQDPLFIAPFNGEPWNYESSPLFGWNFEMASLAVIKSLDGKESMNIMLTGIEGRRSPNDHDSHSNAWIIGNFARDSEYGLFEPRMIGFVDHGIGYSFVTYSDSKNGRMLLFGWAGESDDNLFKRSIKGWAGMHCLPREIFVSEIENVVNVDNQFDQRGSWEISSRRQQDGLELVNLRTLGIRPFAEMKRARESRKDKIVSYSNINGSTILDGFSGKSYSIKSKIIIKDDFAVVGFAVRSSGDGQEQTVVVYDNAHQSIKILRAKSSVETHYTRSDEQGPFALYNLFDPVTGKIKREKLEIEIFVDNSIVEVFVNGRFALTTRIYPVLQKSLFVETCVKGGAEFEDIEIFGDYDKANI